MEPLLTTLKSLSHSYVVEKREDGLRVYTSYFDDYASASSFTEVHKENNIDVYIKNIDDLAFPIELIPQNDDEKEVLNQIKINLDFMYSLLTMDEKSLDEAFFPTLLQKENYTKYNNIYAYIQATYDTLNDNFLTTENRKTLVAASILQVLIDINLTQ